MSRHALTLSVLLVLAPVAFAVCGPDGVQASGSIYRICMPEPGEYNGRLLIWAHGFQDATEPVGIPEDQLTFDETYLPDLINEQGFAFATNSYSKTGLAIRQGMDDIVDLVDLFIAREGVPEKIYLTGASEGGIITTLLVESRPDLFDGGVAACGPVGDFRYQIDYFGHARVLFDYFFPDLIPGDPFAPTQELAEAWPDYYRQAVRPVVFSPAHRGKLLQWLSTARMPYDPLDFEATAGESVEDVLRYGVVDFNDAVETLGGMPFGNRFHLYTGSLNDWRLNRKVRRVDAAATAIQEMEDHYDTSGDLARPLITLHTLLDQQVPYPHETRYSFKTLLSGSYLTRHVNIPVARFGHCEFTVGEALAALGLMLVYAGDAEAIPTDL